MTFGSRHRCWFGATGDRVVDKKMQVAGKKCDGFCYREFSWARRTDRRQVSWLKGYANGVSSATGRAAIGRGQMILKIDNANR